MRGLTHVVTLPPPGPGFIGPGHTAVHVLAGLGFAETDPFIMLADDRVDIAPGERAGAAHPHAGFEIATFVGESRADIVRVSQAYAEGRMPRVSELTR